MFLPLWLLLTSLTLLILSESKSIYAGSAFFKLLSSLSFVWAGISSPLTPPPILWSLLCSLAGDALLIPSRRDYYRMPGSEGTSARFKAGTASFAAAHALYIFGFIFGDVEYESSANWSWGVFVPAALAAVAIGLVATETSGVISVPKNMKWLVRAYLVIIAGMVATAASTAESRWRIGGAVAFMASDLFVALDAFGVRKEDFGRYRRSTGKGRPGWKTRAIGWMLYFGGQLVLASEYR